MKSALLGKRAICRTRLNKNEQARLWAYFAKWKCWRYRRLLHDISMETYMLEAEDDSERLEEEDIPF